MIRQLIRRVMRPQINVIRIFKITQRMYRNRNIMNRNIIKCNNIEIII